MNYALYDLLWKHKLMEDDEDDIPSSDNLMDFIEDLFTEFGLDMQSFVLHRISYYDALDVVQSDDQFTTDAEEYLQHNANHPVMPSEDQVPKLAYNLVFTEPTIAGKLYDELTHYKSLGRI